eukprot:gene15605-21710_t
MEPSADDYELDYGEEDSEPSRIKPNKKFLNRFLANHQRTNDRIVDINASKAAQKAIGASGAASLKLVMQRASRHGDETVRKATLTAAQQQKYILCTALLTEVASTFGFQLVLTGVGDEENPSEADQPTQSFIGCTGGLDLWLPASGLCYMVAATCGFLLVLTGVGGEENPSEADKPTQSFLDCVASTFGFRLVLAGVASTFGFRLVLSGLGDEANPTEAEDPLESPGAAGPSAATWRAPGAKEEAEAVNKEGDASKPPSFAMEDLHAKLQLTTSNKVRTSPPTLLAKSAAKTGIKRTGAPVSLADRPKIQLSSRLTTSALGAALGVPGQRRMATSPAAVALQAAMKNVSSAADEDPTPSEEADPLGTEAPDESPSHTEGPSTTTKKANYDSASKLGSVSILGSASKLGSGRKIVWPGVPDVTEAGAAAAIGGFESPPRPREPQEQQQQQQTEAVGATPAKVDTDAEAAAAAGFGKGLNSAGSQASGAKTGGGGTGAAGASGRGRDGAAGGGAGTAAGAACASGTVEGGLGADGCGTPLAEEGAASADVGKRRPAFGLFGAAMRDIKKVKHGDD